MPALPRLVIASVCENDEPSVSTLALLASLRRRDYEVQHFRSLAAFTPIDYVTPLTGIGSRHLDPWIMTSPLCRELFARSAAAVDLSIIEASSPAEPADSRWQQMAEILNAPVIGVVRSQPVDCFHAPPLPDGLDALFIDGFTSREQYRAEKAALESVSGLPVLGGLSARSGATSCAQKLHTGKRIPGAVLDELVAGLCEATDIERLIDLAESRPFPTQTFELFSTAPRQRSLRVAIAYDKCFHCYFPDTLDALEFLGAEICEFSPLEHERLPDHTDIVYLGCGHPEQFAKQLADNECMRAAMRRHVCSGHRVYAEGGGAAYLCQHLRLPGGSLVPMAGVFAADAELTGQPSPRPRPVELVAERPSWLTASGETLRGYSSGAWRLIGRPGLASCFTAPGGEVAAVMRHHSIGSMVHLNFAAQPRMLDSFFAPHAPSLSI